MKRNKFLEYYLSEIKRYGGLDNYISAKTREKRQLLDKIQKYAKTNRKILEAGCGSASNSIFLARRGFKVTCIDKDPEILKFAQNNAKKFVNKILFLKKDIKSLNGSKELFDVSFSHGVLEHYSDKEIIHLINFQLNVSKYVIISVPSNFFKQEEAINLDERFLSKGHWIKIIFQTEGKLIDTFDYFYDSRKLKIRLLKMLSFLTFNKLPKIKPYIGFVVKRK